MFLFTGALETGVRGPFEHEKRGSKSPFNVLLLLIVID